MLMEKPAHLVLRVRFAFFLTVLLLDALLPSELFFIVDLPWPLMCIILLRVLDPLLVPLLSSSVNILKCLITARKRLPFNTAVGAPQRTQKNTGRRFLMCFTKWLEDNKETSRC